MNLSKILDETATLSATILMPPGTTKAIGLCVYGLLTDGAHHKQWVLEQVLVALGVDLSELRSELQRDGYDWEGSIAP